MNERKWKDIDAKKVALQRAMFSFRKRDHRTVRHKIFLSNMKYV